MKSHSSAADTPRIGVDPNIGVLWLIRLRWGAAVCQLAALAVARSLFAMEMRTPLLALLVGVTAATNVGLDMLRRKRGGTEQLIAAALVFDSVLLTALLMASGGAANPFTVLYLVHVVLAAVLLPMRWTWVLVALSASGFALLFTRAEHAAHTHDPYGSHLQGMWIAYTAAAVVIAYFVGRLSLALRARERELALLREQAANNERLAGLTTLAAGAAHELSTPLATIAVIAKEIQHECDRIENAERLKEDAALIRSELERCRAILEQMSAGAGTSVGELESTISIDRLLELLRSRLASEFERLVIARTGTRDQVVVTPHALIRVLLNLIQNAIDASPATPVELHIAAHPDRLVFEVVDRGSGMPEEVLARATDPFFTTKEPGRGLGLGLFLVKSYADRIGGRFQLASAPGRGTTATIEIPQEPLPAHAPAALVEGAAEG